MYLLPVFLEGSIDKKAFDIIVRHMNENVWVELDTFLGYTGLKDAKNVYQRRCAWEDVYSLRVYPQTYTFLKRKMEPFEDIMNKLDSKDFFNFDNFEYPFIITRVLANAYVEKVEYSPYMNDEDDFINENIIRISSLEERDIVVNAIKDMINNLSEDFFEDGFGKEEAFAFFMSRIEDISTYEDTISDMIGDCDYLFLRAIGE